MKTQKNKTMNYVPVVSLIFILSNLSLTQLSSQTNNEDRYCNGDYQFCVNYPSYIFTKQTDLVGQNGVLLISERNDAEITVSIWPQTSGSTTKEIFHCSAKAKANGKKPKIINAIFGEDFYESFFLAGLSYYYQKSYHFKDYYILLEIRTPINIPDKMQIIKSQVRLEFISSPNAQEVTGSMGKARHKDD
jgi:hypothetical protein